MIDHLLYALAGFICGFFSSAPIGPINLWIADKALKKKSFTDIVPFISGVISADLVLAAAAVWGYVHFLSSETVQFWIATAGAIVLLALGSLMLRKEVKDQKLSTKTERQAQTSSQVGQFFTGAIFCGVNPAFFTFWVVVMAFLSELGMVKPTLTHALVFLACIGLGDGAWFWTLMTFLRKGVNFLKPKAAQMIQRMIGFIFIGAGLTILVLNWI